MFRATPDQMMTVLQKVLQKLNIQSRQSEQFTLRCQCSYSVWSKFINNTGDKSLIRDDFIENDPSNLEFNVMIYEARWAGSKIGFKVKDDDYYQNATLNLYIKQISKNIYNRLLNEIGHIYHSVDA